MSDCKCKNFAVKILGDGCDECNPALAYEYAKECIAEQAAELDELRAKLSALGAEKGPEGWTVPCRNCGTTGYIHAGVAGIPESFACGYCKATGRIPVPLAAPLTGKEEPR